MLNSSGCSQLVMVHCKNENAIGYTIVVFPLNTMLRHVVIFNTHSWIYYVKSFSMYTYVKNVRISFARLSLPAETIYISLVSLFVHV